ncbi:MAG: ABC transporter ATP-binding protein [Clostridia bacterium]|nr:ABC transporter ATP-binding protein [Clostridia bacterium]
MNAENSLAIQIENLTKTYGKNRGIDDVSFEVEKGEIFGFLGPNGAGKSTTIRCLLGLIRPTGGSAAILGSDIVKGHRDIMKRIGYMPSETQFYPSMKVSEVIQFAADVRGVDCREESAKLCQRLKVDTNKRIEELSLGNRKKVGIVCAMQHKPELFIFDEPTSGLDPLIQAEFFELVREYNEQGATCFLSSHVLSEIRKYCRKAAIIREGKLIACDTIENLAHTGAKFIRAEGVSDLALEGMSKVNKTGSGMEFVYSGSMNLLLKALSEKDVKDLSIEEPSLEDVFMQYYD